MSTLQYKVSGIHPPGHWQMRKLKHVLKLRRSNKNDGLKEKNLLSLSYGNIVRRDITNSDGLVPASYEGYQIVYPGDIVLRLTDLQNDKRSLRQGFVKERGIVTSAYGAVHCSKNDDPEYWYFFLYALDISKYYYSLGGGVRQSISFNDFPNDWLAAPTLEEQKRLANRLRRSLFLLNSAVAKIGGNRALQVATEGSLLNVLGKRRESLIVQTIMAGLETGEGQLSDELLERLVVGTGNELEEGECIE